jgi:hypothetical protein
MGADAANAVPTTSVPASTAAAASAASAAKGGAYTADPGAVVPSPVVTGSAAGAAAPVGAVPSANEGALAMDVLAEVGCAVCRDTLLDPVILQCSHAFWYVNAPCFSAVYVCVCVCVKVHIYAGCGWVFAA